MDRFRGMCLFGASAMLAAGVFACASSNVVDSTVGTTGQIADVRVEQVGDTTQVTLLGVDHPVFTAFQETDPARVIIDLVSIHPEQLMEPVAVYDGLVDEVSLAPFSTGSGEAMTRVEISLAGPASYEVVPGDEGLVVYVSGMLAMADSGADDGMSLDDDPWAVMPDGGAMDESAAPMSDDDAETAWVAEAPEATMLTGVEAQVVDNGTLITLLANGTISSAITFTLENPDRLVLDLPDLTTEMSQPRVDVGAPHVERIRVGQHADLVRVVIDAGGATNPFDGRMVTPDGQGLLVALGSGEELELVLSEAMDRAPRAAADGGDPASPGDGDPDSGWALDGSSDAGPDEALDAAELDATADADEGGPATIYGIEFDVQEDHDRIVVLSEQPVDYLVYEPDPETVVVSIEGAVIDPEAAVRITPEPGGPVSLVTAFEQPEARTPEVRVVVKRAHNLRPQVTRRGSLLVIDFAHGAGVAATPPVLAMDRSELQDSVADVPATPGSETVPAVAPQLSAAVEPASMQAPAALAPAVAPVPASLEPQTAIDILREGGLTNAKEYVGRRVSLDFKAVDIADVLRLIAEVSDLNVIAGDEVQGQVTLRLVDVPWDQALDIILLTKGLGFMRVGNVLRIAPSAVIAQEEETRLQERRAKEQLEDLIVKLQPVNYADAKDIEKMVKRLLSPRGSVNIDKRTNTIIIKDIPTVIDEATALIKAIDTQTPQVMIEAKIVEANLDFSREFGSVWSFGAQPLVDGFDSASGAAQNLGFNQFRLHDTGGGNSAVFGNPITAGPTALANLGAFILDEKLNLNLQLQAAEVTGDGKVISSPRVVTLDNSKATIEQGVSIPFQTFENGDAQLEFVDAVLKLEVTPHITSDRSIIMEIQVSRNAPDDSVFTLTGSPAIAKNQVNTETLVKDGQTLVLGGIYVVDKSERQSRVPYLHRIPILGAMFRSNEISDSRKELLIFVTPRIVVSEHRAS